MPKYIARDSSRHHPSGPICIEDSATLSTSHGGTTGRCIEDAVAKATAIARYLPEPPLMPKRREWVKLAVENNHY